MDRRQQKTREAIFKAFGILLENKNYNHITVQEIIDIANIGRSTFYAHFETKDELLKAICLRLFGHIINSAKDKTHLHGLYLNKDVPRTVFYHLLQHLQENDNNILGLLSCQNSDIFLRYFKDNLNELIKIELINHNRKQNQDLPLDFLVNHISSSFVEMILWWLKNKQKYTSKELEHYFLSVITPIL